MITNFRFSIKTIFKIEYPYVYAKWGWEYNENSAEILQAKIF